MLSPLMNQRQLYRLRAPRSGREVVSEVEPGRTYVDSETGEAMEVVAKVLPLAPSESRLLRTPQNLRTCPRCGDLVGKDLNDCHVCGLRLPPP